MSGLRVEELVSIVLGATGFRELDIQQVAGDLSHDVTIRLTVAKIGTKWDFLRLYFSTL